MTDVLHATHFSTNLIPLKVRTPYSPVCKAYYVSWAYGLPVLYTIGKGIAIGDRLVFEVAYLRALLRAP